MDEFRTWLDATLTRISGRSELAQAIRYALARWSSLTHVLRDGRVCLDNSDAGGARAAAIYSLIKTAKINGIDPEHYFRYMLERIADYPVSQVVDLLPWNIVGLRPRLDQRKAA